MTLATVGMFAVAGCTQPGQGKHNRPETAPPSASAPAFDLGALPQVTEGVCANPQIGKVALRDCLLLPPVTEGAGFTVIPKGDEAQYDSTKVKIAEIRNTAVDYTALPPAYQEALKDIMDDAVTTEALAEGTSFVIQQKPTDKDVWPRYGDGTVYIDIATDTTPTTIGDLRSTAVHEATHAVIADWEWDSKADSKILEAYTAELYLSIWDVQEKHSDELLASLEKFTKKVAADYKHKRYNSRVRDALLSGAKRLRDSIKVSGLGSALVDNGYGIDHTSLTSPRTYFLKDLSDADVLKIGRSDALKAADELDEQLSSYLVEYFPYATESRNMAGMVEKIGHPWDSSHEFIPSVTANVELAPDAFVASVQAIKGSRGERVKALIIGIAKKFAKENPDLYKKSNFPHIVERLTA